MRACGYVGEVGEVVAWDGMGRILRGLTAKEIAKFRALHGARKKRSYMVVRPEAK